MYFLAKIDVSALYSVLLGVRDISLLRTGPV